MRKVLSTEKTLARLVALLPYDDTSLHRSSSDLPQPYCSYQQPQREDEGGWAEEVLVCCLLPVWPDSEYPVTEPEDEGQALVIFKKGSASALCSTHVSLSTTNPSLLHANTD